MSHRRFGMTADAARATLHQVGAQRVAILAPTGHAAPKAIGVATRMSIANVPVAWTTGLLPAQTLDEATSLHPRGRQLSREVRDHPLNRPLAENKLDLSMKPHGIFSE